MTASVAGNYASSKLKGMFQNEDAAAASREESMRVAGDRIAKTLGELKGAVMKVARWPRWRRTSSPGSSPRR